MMAIKVDGSKAKARRIGDIQVVTNTKRKFGANNCYVHLRVQLPDNEKELKALGLGGSVRGGLELDLLLTQSQLRTAVDRAAGNVEDLPTLCPLRDLMD